MGLRKTILAQALKHVASLTLVLGVIGGLHLNTAFAVATKYQSSQQLIQQAGYGDSVLEGKIETVSADMVHTPQSAGTSARIVPSKPAFAPPARHQASINRRALVAQGRMISARFPQEPSVLESPAKNPAEPLQQQDDPKNFFGDNQPMPTVPRNEAPQTDERNTPDDSDQQTGELPPEVFRNPFEKERQKKPDKPSVEIPNQTLPDIPDVPPNKRSESSGGSNTRPQLPFSLQTDKVDDEILYQHGRRFNTSPSQSNVYRAPGSNSRAQPDNEIYFVPAYDPIPNKQQSPFSLPPVTQPGQHFQQTPAWPNQYHQPQYQQPPIQYASPQQYLPTQDPPVYSCVVDPPANLDCIKGPMAPVRRRLADKVKHELKDEWGFGDYRTCSNSCCSPCESNACTSCPVFYLGFQGAWNDAFDVSNDLGSELVLDDGSAFFFSLGRMNGRNLRTEIELSFRDNDIRSLLTGGDELPATGQLRAFSGMANAYWEFVDFPTGRFKPYLGVGVGFMSLTTDLRLTNGLTSSNNQDDDSSSSFAYQWMAGLNYKVSNHLDLYGEYRFVDAESFGISSDRNDLSGNFGYSADSVGVGIRWKF